jgi:nitroreductase
MNVIDALKARHSTRAFLDKTIPEATIVEILDAARHAPSGVNTQPWQVAVLSGDSKQNLQEKIERAFRNGETSQLDYQYYPEQWEEPYKSRRKACGLKMYSALEITREDKQRQMDQWAANYRAFDAPVMLLFFMDGGMQTGSFIDYGMFIQSVMLAAMEKGLATCPQASLAEYPELVKHELGYLKDSILVAGMSIGYEDTSAAVNSYRTDREPVEEFTRFFR